MIIREYEDKNIKMILIESKKGYVKHVKSKITGKRVTDTYPNKKTAIEYFNDMMNLSKIYSTF